MTRFLAASFILLFTSLLAVAQGGFPPARVAVAPITEGTLVPTSTYKGTVYYKEIADVANEVEGKVLEVLFEEGDHIKQGDPLVHLDAELLKADIAAARATHKRNIALHEQEKVRMKRVEEMLQSDITTNQVFDDVSFEVQARQQAVGEAAAQVERLETVLSKKTVRAPFDGVVVRRSVERGEWRSAGDTICTYALDGVFDIIVFFAEQHLPWIHKGDTIQATVSGQPVSGYIAEGVTRGDVATRTFPVRIRVVDIPWLLEGMSAEVQMPTGEQTTGLMVPRDALLPQGGDTVVYTVSADNKAQQVRVETIGFQDLNVGIRADELKPGMPVIVKGHERLRPGADVVVEN